MKALSSAAALFVFWLAVTGSFHPADVVSGLVLSGLLGVWSARFLWPQQAPVLTPKQAAGFAAYVPRLVASVVVAAVHVAEVVFDPRMPIDPVVISHRTSFTRDVTRVAYANSITLTPGTLTVDVEGDTFHIHCLAERFADDITSGELEQQVARVFEE